MPRRPATIFGEPPSPPSAQRKQLAESAGEPTEQLARDLVVAGESAALRTKQEGGVVMAKSEHEIVADANALAGEFYRAHGYAAGDGFRFDLSSHPQERMMWTLACIAFEHLCGTEVEEAVASLNDPPPAEGAEK